MTTDFFNAVALPFVLGHEGGYVNDPIDPGGETKYGISKRQYPDLDIRMLSVQQASAIYFVDYWTQVRANDLPKGVALVMFDCAVNQGVGAAIRLLQRALGTVKVDGLLRRNGESETIETARATNPISLVTDLSVLREERYRATQNFERFGLGWLRRNAACTSLALAQHEALRGTVL